MNNIYLDRHSKHHCYTEGVTKQKIIADDAGRLIWQCQHCNHKVDDVTADEAVQHLDVPSMQAVIKSPQIADVKYIGRRQYAVFIAGVEKYRGSRDNPEKSAKQDCLRWVKSRKETTLGEVDI